VDFAGKWKIWATISLVVIISGFVMIGVKGLNLSIDFKGGNLLEIKYAESVSSEQIRDVLRDFDLEKNPIQSAGDNRYIIRTETLPDEKANELLQAMEKELGDLDILRNEKVAPVIGGELTRNGIIALVLATILMIAYITYRFEFYFAVGGIAALLHDVLIMLSFMAIFQLEVDMNFIAAVLTILGYSINDTIVIFDRIRENSKSRKYKELAPLVNDSIMQTLRRTINTAVATIITLVALIVLGGDTTKVFAISLLVGCVSGAYSTIFIASPVWMVLKQKRSMGKRFTAQKVQ